MQIPQYDVFSGAVDKHAIWLEAVDGLGNAQMRMKWHAAKKPGPYFVFCQETRSILEVLDTSQSICQRQESA